MTELVFRAEYVPDAGLHVTLYSRVEGVSFILPQDMTLAAIERHLHELRDWLS